MKHLASILGVLTASIAPSWSTVSAQSCDSATASHYGSACHGGGLAPTQTMIGAELNRYIALSGATPNGSAALCFAIQSGSLVLPGGCELLVDPNTVFSGLLPVDGQGNAFVAIPPIFEIQGFVPIYAQWLLPNDQAPSAATDGMKVEFHPGCVSEVALATQFSGSTGPVADAAFEAIRQRGKAGISALMTVMNSAVPLDKFAGTAPQAPWNGTLSIIFKDVNGDIQLTSESTRRMAMYAVEAILENHQYPYGNSFLVHVTAAINDPEVLDTEALSHYNSWWTASSGKTLPQLQIDPRALDLSGVINWHGGRPRYGPFDGGGLDDIFPFECLEDTETPIQKPLMNSEIDEVLPGLMLLPPAVVGGPRPVNCFGHSIGVDGWIFATPDAINDRPLLPDGDNWYDAYLSSKGYAPVTNPPANYSNLIMLVYCSPHGTCDDKDFKHALSKAGPNAPWTSKDEEGPVYSMDWAHLAHHLQQGEWCKDGEIMITKLHAK